MDSTPPNAAGLEEHRGVFWWLRAGFGLLATALIVYPFLLLSGCFDERKKAWPEFEPKPVTGESIAAILERQPAYARWKFLWPSDKESQSREEWLLRREQSKEFHRASNELVLALARDPTPWGLVFREGLSPGQQIDRWARDFHEFPYLTQVVVWYWLKTKPSPGDRRELVEAACALRRIGNRFSRLPVLHYYCRRIESTSHPLVLEAVRQCVLAGDSASLAEIAAELSASEADRRGAIAGGLARFFFNYQDRAHSIRAHQLPIWKFRDDRHPWPRGEKQCKASQWWADVRFLPNRETRKAAEAIERTLRDFQQPSASRPRRLPATPAKDFSLSLAPNAGGDWLRPSYLEWPLIGMMEMEDYDLTCHRLMLALVAVCRYKTEHRAYPPDLSVLVPRYLPAIPEDPYDGKPLRFDPGRGLLWSVGSDGIDGGGVNKEIHHATEAFDLIAPWNGQPHNHNELPVDLTRFLSSQ
jgi:hypothetical protein